MDPKSKNKPKSFTPSSKKVKHQNKETETGNQKPEDERRDFKNVCILLVLRHDMLLVEPSKSSTTSDRIIKPLSIKFGNGKNAENVIPSLVKKYKLSGIYDQSKKIELVDVFQEKDKTFFVFTLRQNSGNIHADGSFRFVQQSDIINGQKVQIKGIGDCTVTKSLKMALESTLVAV